MTFFFIRARRTRLPARFHARTCLRESWRASVTSCWGPARKESEEPDHRARRLRANLHLRRQLLRRWRRVFRRGAQSSVAAEDPGRRSQPDPGWLELGVGPDGQAERADRNRHRQQALGKAKEDLGQRGKAAGKPE